MAPQPEMAGSKKGRNFYKPDSSMSSASGIVIARVRRSRRMFSGRRA